MSLVVHFEIHASDPDALMQFYGDLLGWRFTRFGDATYWAIDTGEGSVRQADQAGFGINGGLTQREGPRPEVGAPVQGANVVVAVDDVDAVHARALAAGAKEAVAPNDMEGVGRLAYVLDPDNNVLGLIQPSM